MAIRVFGGCKKKINSQKRAFDDVAVELLRRAEKEGTARGLDGDDVTSAQNLF